MSQQTFTLTWIRSVTVADRWWLAERTLHETAGIAGSVLRTKVALYDFEDASLANECGSGVLKMFLAKVRQKLTSLFRLRFTLQWKILLLVAVSMSLIILASSYLHTVRTRRLVEQDHYENAVNQLTVLTDRISRYDYFTSLDDLQQELQLVAGSRPDFKQIDIYETTANGPTLIGTTAQGPPELISLVATPVDETQAFLTASQITRRNSDYWLITAQIKNPRHSGFMQALVLKSIHHQLVDSLHREYNFLMLGAVAASVGLLYLLFSYFFRRPVKEILGAMERTREGTLSSRAPVHRDDELGAIALGFNRLMDDIATRSCEREELLHQISELNDSLLKRVEVATRELRAANLNLISTQQKLAYSERMAAIGQVAASLAHEIGTPLNAINGHLQLLSRKHADTPETQRRIKIIDNQLEVIVQSVKSLLERTHRKRMSVKPTNLNGVVRELMMLVGPMLETRNINAEVDLDLLEPTVAADADSLNQVFLNLINNSCDAMPEGGVIRIATRYSQDSQLVEMIVSDSGTGVSSQVEDHLFEPLFTTKVSGSGLGLVIAREIVGEHRGEIELLSQHQRGAAFRISLPALAVASASQKVVDIEANAA